MTLFEQKLADFVAHTAVENIRLQTLVELQEDEIKWLKENQKEVEGEVEELSAENDKLIKQIDDICYNKVVKDDDICSGWDLGDNEECYIVIQEDGVTVATYDMKVLAKLAEAITKTF